MKKWIFLFAGLLIFALLSWVVWIPDILFGTVNTIARVESSLGDRFELRQYWDADFYTIQLKHYAKNGRVDTFVVDPDAPKVWLDVTPHWD